MERGGLGQQYYTLAVLRLFVKTRPECRRVCSDCFSGSSQRREERSPAPSPLLDKKGKRLNAYSSFYEKGRLKGCVGVLVGPTRKVIFLLNIVSAEIPL